MSACCSTLLGSAGQTCSVIHLQSEFSRDSWIASDGTSFRSHKLASKYAKDQKLQATLVFTASSLFFQVSSSQVPPELKDAYKYDNNGYLKAQRSPVGDMHFEHCWTRRVGSTFQSQRPSSGKNFVCAQSCSLTCV